MQRNIKEHCTTCFGILQERKCSDISSNLVSGGRCALQSQSTDFDSFFKSSVETIGELNDGGNDGESKVNSTDMGGRQSINFPPMLCSNDTTTSPDTEQILTCRTKKNSNSESSSSDEDPAAREVDIKGRVTASDADLINVQRNEKTDVSAGLEDRWMRSHFSDARANAQYRNSQCDEKGNLIIDANHVGVPNGDNEESSVRDIKIKSSNECITISSESRTHSHLSASKNINKRLSILHFNDVYELTARKKEPVGGAARFTTLFNQVHVDATSDCGGEKPFIAFGGDCLNPSILSSATKGKHMIEVLNYLKVTAAVYGNHEFDFGVDHAATCIESMDFPWFISNVTEKCNGEPLGRGEISKIVEWNGLQLGIIGLIEEEWLDTLTTIDKCDLCFEDYVSRGNQLSQELKDNGADLVIALTHMRWPNDIRLAHEVKNIDVILGGHDHEYGVKLVDGCIIVKSGCEFQTFSRVDLYLKHGGKIDVSVTRYDVTSDIEPDDEMNKIVNRYTTVLEDQLQQSIGTMKTSLDGLYKHVRSRETNLGNFVADIMRMTTRAEIVLINSGTFRSNTIHTDKEFSVRDLMSILPIHDNVVIIEVTGEQLLQGLENAVSKYPRHEGRFAQISGFCFGFDSKAAPGKRVVRDSVRIHGEPLNLIRYYKMATKAYVARGRDGYECFSKCRLFNDPDSGPVVSTVVRNHISNVSHLIRHEERTGDKLRVTEKGKKILSTSGDLHEVFSACFEDAPVYKLQKSMEDILPVAKKSDINGNRKRRDSEHSKKRDFVDDADHGLYEGRAMHMQHLLEIVQDDVFLKSEIPKDRFANKRRKALEENKENYKLLNERTNSPQDVRWQIFPLLEARVFHCPKK